MRVDHVVVGGGLTGLSAALFLKLRNINCTVTVFESSERLGGWIRSKRFPDGSVHELGPRTIRMQSSSVNYLLNLISNINATETVIPISKGDKNFHNRYIFANKELSLLDFSLLKPAQKPFSQSMLTTVVKAALKKYEHENVFQDLPVDYFVRTRFGNEIADYVVDPVIRGIYACDSKDLSIQSTFPDLIKREEMGPNIVIGSLKHYLHSLFGSNKVENLINCPSLSELAKNSSVLSFKGGLETIIDFLKLELNKLGVEIQLSNPVLKLKQASQEIEVISSSSNVKCKNLILATPSFISSSLLSGMISNCNILDHIHWNNVAVVVLEYKGRHIPYLGFGHLIPSWEMPDTLGVIYDSCILPDNDCKDYTTTRYTIMLGGAWYYPNIDQLSSSELIAKAREVLKSQIGVEGDLVRSTVAVNSKCIPVYGLKHRDLVSTIRQSITDSNLPIHLCGNSYDGVSLSDCVFSAHKAVERVSV